MPLTQPGATSTTPKRRQRTKAPVYPTLPDTENSAFWLAALLRDHAEHEALIKLADKTSSKRVVCHHALVHAQYEKLQKIKETSGKYCLNDGLLPFAWAGTTYFEQVPA
jgi:hypothetical protein